MDMLDALLAVPVPDGYTSVRRERYDAVLDYTFRDVTVSPPGVEVSTFRFGTPGAYAHIGVDDSGTYTVGVFATHVAYHVQRVPATSCASRRRLMPSGARSTSCAANYGARNEAGV